MPEAYPAGRHPVGPRFCDIARSAMPPPTLECPQASTSGPHAKSGSASGYVRQNVMTS
jgi:hypothetical protein